MSGYLEPPAVGTEAETLLGSLERMRATFAWKCAGLDRAALSQRLPTSDLNLGRLLKHLAYLEDINFTGELGKRELPRPWAGRDLATRSEWVFSSADDDEPETLYACWRDAVERSRAVVQEVLAGGGPEVTYTDGGHVLTLRRLLVDFIEEYARHTGHADLLREAIDGRVGEDPPGPAAPYALAAP